MASNAEQSRVLTLVFTDLADSTALKTERGDRVVHDLIEAHRAHVTRLADECSGRVIDWAGDGCFLTFETSSAAAMFALRLQHIHAENIDLPDVRIGIHMGEVSVSPGPGEAPRVDGLAVDLAARISGLAKPGQVLMSAAVYNSARQRLGVEAFGQPILWQAHGTYELKGFDEPLLIGEAGVEGVAPLEAPKASEKAKLIKRAKKRGKTSRGSATSSRQGAPIWAVVVIVLLVLAVGLLAGRGLQEPNPSGEDSPLPPDGAADLEPITSLAVLPLDNLMNDPEQDYFADGMTEAITAELAKIKALRVISRTSVMRYKETELSMPEIAAELGVEGLIEGSVLRDGDDVRVTVQLIHGASDTHLWSESYTQTMTSVLKLQADIALAVAEEIDATITPEERRRVAAVREVNPEAYENYLLGSHFLDEFTEEGQTEAAQYFQRATELDPDFADAWVGLGESLTYTAFRPSAEGTPAARAAYLRALELDGTHAKAHGGLGKISMYYDREWEQAEARFKRAIELAPNDAAAYVSFATNRLIVGQHDEALQLASTALDLDPENHRVLHEVGWAFTFTGELDRGRQVLERALELRPDFILAIEILIHNHIMSGNFDEGIAMAQRHIEVSGGDVFSKLDMVDALSMAGRMREAEVYLNEILEGDEYVQSADLAWAYIKLGRIDEAFAAFEEGFKQRDWVMVWLTTGPYFPRNTDSPFYQTFREDPRYRDLVERMGFPPLPSEHPGYADQQAYLERKAAAEAANAPIEKIAVLPFENMSSDPEQEFFVDGMTEALIAELAKIKSLKVISRTSVMRYKDTDKLLKDIALELGVDAIVEGSVLKADDSVRITAQLIRGATDEHLWAASRTAPLENILKLQAEVALSMTDEINAAVTPEERSRIASARPVNPEAYEYYAQGRHFWSQRTEQGFMRARQLFENALELDPDFALGHVGLADTFVSLGDYNFLKPAEAFTRAREEVDKALVLDPALGEAYTSLGKILNGYEWKWEEAEEALLKGIELNPGYATAYQFYGEFLQGKERRREAAEQIRIAHELDPVSPIIGIRLAQVSQYVGRHVDAIEQAENTAFLYPDVPRVLWGLSDIYFDQARYNDALDVLEKIGELDWHPAIAIKGKIVVLGTMGRETEARRFLEELHTISEDRYVSPLAFAACYAAIGETDHAIEWLEKAYAQRTALMSYIRGLSEFDSIRDDPRFQDIVDRMNFPEPVENN